MTLPPTNPFNPTLAPDQPPPYYFARRVLGVRPWHKQREILDSLLTHNRIAVKSGNGLGKGFTAAIALLWFLHTHKPAIALSTAPTFRQVRHILWRQIHHLHRRNPKTLGGQLHDTRWELAPDRYALGLSADTADQFQGFHSPNLLLIVDEAEGVAEPIYEAIEAIMTTAHAQLLLIGNPTTNSGAFRRAFHQEQQIYKTITMSALDSPNLTAGQTRIPGLATQQWVQQRANLWGTDNPLYQARILGQFPTQTQDALINLTHLETATRLPNANHPIDLANHPELPPSHSDTPTGPCHSEASAEESKMPLDQPLSNPQPAPANRHSHETGNPAPTTWSCHSEQSEESKMPALNQPSNPETLTAYPVPLSNQPHPAYPKPAAADANHPPLTQSQSDQRPEPPIPSLQINPHEIIIAVDPARFGSDHSIILRRHGPHVTSIQSYHHLDTMTLTGHIAHQIQQHHPTQTCIDEIGIGAGIIDRLKEQGYGIRPVNTSRKARQPHLYANLRAEAYHHLAQLLERHLITLPNDPQLIGQLAALRYTYDSSGRMLIEPKEKIRSRGLPSPDKADALMLAFLPPPPPPKPWT